MNAPHRKILVLYAHPTPRRSRINRPMIDAIRDLESVTVHDLYEQYPDYDINTPREQELLRKHDVVVLQHPFYWYSAPAIIKEWCDLVLEYGFAFGEGGGALEGKSWIHALTAGGPQEAYRHEGANRFTIPQLLAPFDQTAHLCGMRFLPPFAVHATLRLDAEHELPRVTLRYRRLLETLRDPNVALDSLRDWNALDRETP